MSCTRPLILAVALLAPMALPLAGCANTDPFTREGTWKPSGVNDANMAAQVANPADLARGRADNSGTFRTGASAVDRLWQGGPPRAQQAAQTQGQGQQGQGRPGEAPRP